MRLIHSLVLGLNLPLAAAVAFAAPAVAPVREEIVLLLTKLQASGCTFNRNGTWYSGAEAKDHPRFRSWTRSSVPQPAVVGRRDDAAHSCAQGGATPPQRLDGVQLSG